MSMKPNSPGSILLQVRHRNKGWEEKAAKPIIESDKSINKALRILSAIEANKEHVCIPTISCLMPT